MVAGHPPVKRIDPVHIVPIENAKKRLLAEMLDAKRSAAGAPCEPQQTSFQSPEKAINDPKDMVRRQMQ
jgi:hypothetical protein